MTQIIIDQPLISQLDGVTAPVEVVDASGRRLGHFVPTVVMNGDDCPYSPSELARMRREPGGRPLAEIWKSLGAT